MMRWAGILVVAAVLTAAGTPAFAQAQGFVATVKSESTDLRKNANGLAPSIDTVLKGTKLPAFGLSPDKNWVRVRAPDGATVWVSRNDVKVTRATEPEPPIQKVTPVPARAKTRTRSLRGERKLAHVVVDKTKLQINASKSSPTLSVARRNEEFEVAGFSRDQLWVKVATSDGTMGYIPKADLRPGRAPKRTASTPRPKPTPRAIASEGFDDPNSGFDDPNSGFDDEPPEEDLPPRRRRMSSASDLTVWADAGLVLINETMTSDEGFGYELSAMGYGAGVRFERRMPQIDGLFVEGGYLGTANQRIPAPESTTTVFSTLHRIDVSARYKYHFIDDEGPNVSLIGGLQNYSFIVQPQNLSWFYSQIYTSGALGLGGEYPFGDWRVGGDVRYFVPVLASERYGNGGKGGSGQGAASTGYSAGIGVRRQFYSGASLGLGYRGHFYQTEYSGTGKRGPNEVHGVVVKDTFQAVTLTYARGF